jgi:hypothetical protein
LGLRPGSEAHCDHDGSLRGPATGSATFKDGTITLGQGALSGGKASLTPYKLDAETRSIIAVFAVTANFLGSTSPVLGEKVNRP